MTPFTRSQNVATTSSVPTTQRRVSATDLLVTPMVIMIILVVLAFWVNLRDLSAMEARVLNWPVISEAVIQHLVLVGTSTAFVMLFAIPVGIALAQPEAQRVAPIVQSVFVIGQSTPTFGILVLFAITLGLGTKYAIIALIITTFLPVLSNTIVGIRAIDPSMVEAARGIGMSRRQVLTRIELPIAIPILLAGLRTAIVWNVGTATIASFAGAGGLGGIIEVGLTVNRDVITVVGGVLTVVLALMLDHLARVTEIALHPRGL